MQRLDDLIRDPVRWTTLSLLLLLSAAGWTWRSAATDTTGGLIPSPRQGFLAPEFTLDLLDGGHITLSELRGKAVVVNLWASWCPPCRAEMPALQAAYLEEAAQGLEIVAVHTTFQDDMRAAAEFAHEFDLTFPIALDRDGVVSRQYLLRALPSTYFIGPDGVIREVVIGGPMSEATIRSAIAAARQDQP